VEKLPSGQARNHLGLGGVVERGRDNRQRVERAVLRIRHRIREKRRNHLTQAGTGRRTAGRICRAIGVRRCRVHVVMMVMAMRAADCLRQVLHVWKRVVLRRRGEIIRELVQFARLSGVAVGRCRIRCILQIRGNLRGHLLIFGWVRLLQLLQRTHDLREGRQLRSAVLR